LRKARNTFVGAGVSRYRNAPARITGFGGIGRYGDMIWFDID